MKADLLIRNGRVIDPFLHTDEVRDIAVCDGVIADCGGPIDAAQSIDASGCLVTPGLIDFHAHAFPLGSEFSIYPESQCFPTGVTTIVDAGSSGAANYEIYRAAAKWSRVRQFAYLNVSASGLSTVHLHENVDPAHFETKRIASLFKKYPQELLGLKLRASKAVVDSLGASPIHGAFSLAEELKVPLVCHVTDAPIPSDELVALFRPGDVYTHVYHGKGYTILGSDGHVMPEFFKARERGVIFDAANGKSHFSVRVAKAALADGFLPDIISTDQTVNNAWLPGLAFSLPHTMSRYLALGMDEVSVIERVTVNPARQLHREKELGSLLPGTCADIAIHSLVQKETVFCDPLGESIRGNLLFKTQLTLREGQVVYRQIDF